MIKVLILAYDYLPLPSAGAQRPYSWYKYLKDFGVYPVVVTRYWDENSGGVVGFVRPSSRTETEIEVSEHGTLVRVPYRPNLRDKIILKYGEKKCVFIRKILSFLLSILKFYFRKLDNTDYIYQAADTYLKKNKCDLIMATGEPFILFRHAYYLSKNHNLPYILDYRDGWTKGLNLEPTSRVHKKINGILFRHLEKKYLRHAKSITVAAQALIPKLESIYLNQDFVEILNGYFEESFSGRNFNSLNQDFTIIYSGRLYDSQPFDDFMTTLTNVAKEFPSVKTDLKFIGGIHDKSIQKRIKKYEGNNIINIDLMPRLNYEKYVELLLKADVLLLLSANTGGILNAKLFDYLPSGKRILLFRSDKDVVEKIISECNAGYIYNNINELQNGLRCLFREFEQKGFLSGLTSGFEKFTRKNQVLKLAQHISKCVE